MNCAMEPEASFQFSEDYVLGGRVRLKQPRTGYRAGLDAVLLAACIPAQAGEHILDLGAGVGTVGLCLAARIAHCAITGIESDADMAALALENAALNGWEGRVHILHQDISARGLLSGHMFDHVMANPPFHEAHRHRAPALGQRARALMEGAVKLADWVHFALKRTNTGGSVTFILRADRLDDILAALDGKAGMVTIRPIHSARHEPAIRIIIQARKGRKTPLVLLPALVLFDHPGQQSQQAEAILAKGAAL